GNAPIRNGILFLVTSYVTLPRGTRLEHDWATEQLFSSAQLKRVQLVRVGRGIVFRWVFDRADDVDSIVLLRYNRRAEDPDLAHDITVNGLALWVVSFPCVLLLGVNEGSADVRIRQWDRRSERNVPEGRMPLVRIIRVKRVNVIVHCGHEQHVANAAPRDL